eukprot:6307518-Pyramimonas_sp.AAC.1
MLYDAYDQFDLQEDPAYVVARDILNADDALLLSRRKQNMEDMLLAIITEDGGAIKSVREAVYPGGLITCDGKVAAELTRRLGGRTET